MWPFGNSAENRLKQELRQNPALSHLSLEVSVKNSLATITGDVDNQPQIGLINITAQAISGIEQVNLKGLRVRANPNAQTPAPQGGGWPNSSAPQVNPQSTPQSTPQGSFGSNPAQNQPQGQPQGGGFGPGSFNQGSSGQTNSGQGGFGNNQPPQGGFGNNQPSQGGFGSGGGNVGSNTGGGNVVGSKGGVQNTGSGNVVGSKRLTPADGAQGLGAANSNLSEAVLRSIRSHPQLQDDPIDILQRGNTIVLRGGVDSQEELNLAVQLARSVPGVASVEAADLHVIQQVKRLSSRDAASGEVMYTVQPGDTLAGIAKQYYGDGSRERFMEIARANNLNNPDQIRAGQRLKIPGGYRNLA